MTVVTVLKNHRKTLVSGVLAAALAAGCVTSASAQEGTPLLRLDVELGEGIAAYTRGELKMHNYKSQVFDQIRALRAEAWDDSRVKINGVTIPRLAASAGFTSKEAYVNGFVWNSEFEHEVIQRAAESLFELSHTRLNGQSWSSVGLPLRSGGGELLSPYPMESAIHNFSKQKVFNGKSEFDNLIENNGGTTGHYVALIDPQVASYAIASVGRSTAVLFSYDKPRASDTPVAEGRNVAVPVAITKEEASRAIFWGEKTVTVGKQAQLQAMVPADRSPAILLGDYATTNQDVATVDRRSGVYTGIAAGQADLVFNANWINTDGVVTDSAELMRSTVTVAEEPQGIADMSSGSSASDEGGVIEKILSVIAAIIGIAILFIPTSML